MRSVALAALVVMLSPVLVVRQAGATTYQDCQALITGLRADTEAVVITGKNAAKDRAGLLGKLDNASTALERGKLCGAIQKLNDFRNKVNQLIASGNINTDPTVGVTGQDLANDATDAINCIQAQAAASGVVCPTWIEIELGAASRCGCFAAPAISYSVAPLFFSNSTSSVLPFSVATRKAVFC